MGDGARGGALRVASANRNPDANPAAMNANGRIRHVGDIAGAALRILFETAGNDAPNVTWRRRRQSRQIRRALDDRCDHVRGRIPREGRASREHFIQHAAERPDVGALVDPLAACLFWTHVGGGAKNHALRGTVNGDGR